MEELGEVYTGYRLQVSTVLHLFLKLLISHMQINIHATHK